MTFDLDLEKALERLGIKQFLPIQEKVVPILREKKDCIVQAKTGSGKTLSYVLPILESLTVNQKQAQCLVLVPTRELAKQVKEVFDQVGCFKKIKTLCLTGKSPISYQEQDLKQRVHVIVGTPGRVLEHFQRGNIDGSMLSFCVLDEADELLNQDFLKSIQSIFMYLRKDICHCFLSATYPCDLLIDFMKDPIFVQMEEEKIKIEEHFIQTKNKNLDLLRILSTYKPESCIVFCQRQDTTKELYEFLRDLDVNCDYIAGNLEQEQRFLCMDQFKQGKTRILIATDVASRGIDVERVELIINYDFPESCEKYVHRIGRSARVHEKGKAFTFVDDLDQMKFVQLEDYLHVDIDLEQLDGNIDLTGLNERVRYNEDKNKKLKKDVLKLYINAGKSKKVRAGDIAGAISQIEGLNFDDVGIIQVQDHQSYVEILNGKGNLVLNNLKTIKKKKVKVEKASA
ncbi:DEAD/DEAH box helicase [Floccifex sp.]|uniref:DEAD/DEAH box helicase n=1 Tax=Floccifex sp. TaxID=2815810 RepID=UPI002A74A11E|nr:DEAD/DEAH box helicase [Floccifex sp.]MDY2957479.1 DEAD/DEAH box helicase [Floccifex sp.]